MQVRLLVRSAVLKRDMEKDQIMAEDDLTVAEQWLPPSQAAMSVSSVQAIGRAAARKLNSGERLRDNSLRRDAMVKRGEQVIVRCLVGGVAISMQAEARTDGAEGDTIELRKPGERDTFRATITGRGQAVVDLRAGQDPNALNT
jgi:flagella basal body P-ring formation protein FlgA